jgi:outer membrane protein insertion porin family
LKLIYSKQKKIITLKLLLSLVLIVNPSAMLFAKEQVTVDDVSNNVKNKEQKNPSQDNSQLKSASGAKVIAKIYQDKKTGEYYGEKTKEPAIQQPEASNKNQSEVKEQKVVTKSDENNSKKDIVNNNSSDAEKPIVTKKIIGNIEIIGLERLDENLILELIDYKNVKNFSASFIENALQKIYESDFFADVKIYRRNKFLVIELKENPLISEIKFVGNDKIDDEALTSEISLKKRSIFTKAKLQNDLKRINELYIKSGRFLAKIEPKIIQKEQNRLEVIFDINEGKKAKIAKIYFLGNQEFADSELLNEISTKQSQWWRFLSSSDSFDSDRVEFDKEMLRRFYNSNGFADFAVISSSSQISANKDRFFITFLLEEGIKYNFGKINIINEIDKFDSKILNKKILIKEGSIYDAQLLEKTVDAFIETMSEASFAFGDVQPILRRNRELKTIDVDFVIAQTPRVYINQIRINGNTRTLDEVIRREMRLREGDPYNLTKINRSKQRIENLNFFEKVEFRTKRLNESDKVDIEIEVKEKKTGELTLGIGYSTIDRLTGNAGIRENNLFGTGQELGINMQKSYWRQNVEIGYTKPYFMSTNLTAGIDLFKYDQVGRNIMMFDQKSMGSVFRGSYAINEFLSHQLKYSINDVRIGNVDNVNTINPVGLRGNFLSSAIGQGFFYDKRNNRINPTRGYFLSFNQEYSGIAGNVNYIKNEGSSAFYLPIYKNDYIFKLSARGGVIDGIGQGVRSNFGYFLGGNDFRGFDFNGLGPRTKDANGSAKGGFSVGGKIYYVGTAEMRFPLGLPKELGIYGALFSENGLVKSVDKDVQGARYGIADSSLIRSSYGLSIAWSSPMGPIRLDFSKVARKEVYDRTQVFRFSFGTSF